MAMNQPPTTVSELVARVTTATGNIAKHRQAMAEVAALAKVPQPATPTEGVKQQ